MVGDSVTYNFPTGNKINLFTEYESVTEKVSLPAQSILQGAKQLHYARILWHVSRPGGIQIFSKRCPAFSVSLLRPQQEF
jgi:hypothetical protein